jgi:hypothetical protein
LSKVHATLEEGHSGTSQEDDGDSETPGRVKIGQHCKEKTSRNNSPDAGLQKMQYGSLL